MFARISFIVSFVLLSVLSTVAQAPSAIQIFMPNGDRPSRELRLILTRDDGRYDIQFTDTKGKFQLTGDLNRDREYSITVEGDGRTFDTTTANIRILRGSTTYLPIFLRPVAAPKSTRPSVVNVAVVEEPVPADAAAKYATAMEALNRGLVNEAVDALKKAIAIHPTYLRALNDLGVLYLQLNRLDEAGQTLREAIKVNGRFDMAKLNLAIVLNRQKNFSEALGLLKDLAKQPARPSGVTLALADAFIGSGDLTAAKEVLHTASLNQELDNASLVEAHYKLGMLLMREENYSGAVSELEKAVSLDPKAANAYLLLGGAQLELARYDQAEHSLLRSYELGKQEMGNAQLMLGQLYVKQQKYQAAIDAFELYLKDVPTASNAAQVRSGIDSLKKALAEQKPAKPTP